MPAHAYSTIEAERPSTALYVTGGLLIAVGTALLTAATSVASPASSLYASVAPSVAVRPMMAPAMMDRAPSSVQPLMAPAEDRFPTEIYAKGRGKAGRSGPPGQQGAMQKPPTPPVDPDNEEFVLFVRSAKIPTVWIPYTIVTGGSQANQLVKSAQGNMMKDMFSNQLVRSIGEVIYRDQPKIEKSLKAANIPILKGATKFEYGFKIRDKTRPDAWVETKNIIVIPPLDELPSTPMDKVGKGLAGVAEKLGLKKD